LAAVIGIEKIGVYPCSLSLDIAELCAARGLDAQNFCGRLFCDERSVMGPFEDPVTMAVNAALPVLTDADRESCPRSRRSIRRSHLAPGYTGS
jgi:3-hydroxy-3-methylglutaryl CoA synthase